MMVRLITMELSVKLSDATERGKSKMAAFRQLRRLPIKPTKSRGAHEFAEEIRPKRAYWSPKMIDYFCIAGKVIIDHQPLYC